VNNVLVVAGVTAGSDELHQAMLAEARRAPSRFVLVMPRCSGGARAAMDAAFALEYALARASDAGLEVSGRFGDSDPVIAAVENYDPWLVDRIIVSTRPARLSRWCGADVPARVSRLTGAPVVHVQVRAADRSQSLVAAGA
jgi:hypothetical protein